MLRSHASETVQLMQAWKTDVITNMMMIIVMMMMMMMMMIMALNTFCIICSVDRMHVLAQDTCTVYRQGISPNLRIRAPSFNII